MRFAHLFGLVEDFILEGLGVGTREAISNDHTLINTDQLEHLNADLISRKLVQDVGDFFE